MKQLFALTMILSLSGALYADLETIPAGETEAIARVTSLVEAQVRGAYAKTGVGKRDVHVKAHGCVKGIFTVSKNLRADLETTVFASGAEYPAWIRFSNGGGSREKDSAGDGRGFAMKLTNVPGEKLSSDEVKTQDFLLINHPAFFVRTVADYVDFFEATAGGSPLGFFFPGVNPASWRVHEARVAQAIRSKPVTNPVAIQYWSMTPYLHKNRAVKYSVRPCGVGGHVEPDKNDPNFLRQALVTQLTTRNSCFEFFSQVQGNPKNMPIEDPTIEWSEKESVPVKLGTLTILKQRFNSPAQEEFCEQLSFNPWHSVIDHRPLGGVNRARRQVYETISRVRHDLNKAKLIEPTGEEVFH